MLFPSTKHRMIWARSAVLSWFIRSLMDGRLGAGKSKWIGNFLGISCAVISLGLLVSGYAQSNPPSPSEGESSKNPVANSEGDKTGSDAPKFILPPVAQAVPVSLKPNQQPITSGNEHQAQKESPQRKWWEDPDWWVAGFTFVICGIAIWQGVLFRTQINATQESAIHQLRAYIQINPGFMCGIRDAETDKPTARPRLIFRLINHGLTPAKSVTIGCGIFLGETVPGRAGSLPENNPPKSSSPIDVFPNASLPEALQEVTEVGMSNPLTPQQIAAVHNGGRTLCVMGKATYKDVFGKDRKVEFCFALLSEGGIMTKMVVATPDQRFPVQGVYIEKGNKWD